MTTIKVVGKNLWNKSNYDHDYGGVLDFVSLNPNAFELELGPPSIDGLHGIGFELDLKPLTSYTFSSDVEFISRQTGTLRIALGTAEEVSNPMDVNLKAVLLRTSGRVEISATTSLSGRLLVFFYKNGYGAFRVRCNEIQIEQGNKATEFEPYKEQILQFDTSLLGWNGTHDYIDPYGRIIKKLDWLPAGQAKTHTWQALSNTYRIDVDVNGMLQGGMALVVLPDLSSLRWQNDFSGDYEHTYTEDSTIYIFVAKTRIDSYSGADIDEKISNFTRDLTIIYPLADAQTSNLDAYLSIYPSVSHIVLPNNLLATVRGRFKHLGG